jgi:lipopolysaccharide/colanic/teichoic acid biosynthesis glycosyltransferase
VKALVWVLVLLLGIVVEAELIAWCHPLQKWLIRRVAAPLPRQHRDRYIEEWYRELEEIPDGPVTRVLWILSLLLRRGSVARALGVPRTVVGFTGVLKRLIDIVVAAVGLVTVFPLMLCIAAVIKLQDGGPVIIRQSRLGLDGKPFVMVRFRSMIVDAEAREVVLIEPKEYLALRRWLGYDPRITRFGKFLRNFALDELPNLINVVTGSMSLVGPRPRLVSESVDDAIGRASVKPGLTGLWQTSPLSDLDTEDATRRDREYAKHWSPWLDIKIVIKTLIAVLCERGS